MNVLGVYSGFGINQHDPGAALLRDGEVVCVAEEERFSRIKSARGLLPIRALRSCLAQGGLRMEDIDLVVSPGEKSEHQQARIASYLKHFFGHVPRIRLVNHQTAHNASAFYASGFSEAMCLSYEARWSRSTTATRSAAFTR
jgi:carbamoyltransferase